MTKKVLNSQPTNKKSNSEVVRVENYLDALLSQKEVEARQVDASYADLLAQVRALVSRGGKRLRPKLVINAYKAFGGTDMEAITKAAASQELFHTFALVHDDIIDRDIVRWGGPNISGHYLKVFAKKYEPQEARHYADSWALLAGDLCLGLSLEALSASGFAHNRIAKATRLVQQSLFRMIGGELMDVAAPVYGLAIDSSDEDYFTRLYASKTSVYSFCMPLRLGALLAGAGLASDRQLEAFGYHTGIAFQLKDDILGVFGDESKTGKSTLSDLREGKRTMLISLGYKAANSRQKQILNRVLGNPKASYKDLGLVQDILKTTGALGRTQSAMQRHCDEARNILLRAGFPMSLNSHLADLLAFSVKRSS